MARLSNDEYIKIQLVRREGGKRVARVFTVGWKIPKGSSLEEEAYLIAKRYADEVEVHMY
ncbi:MAG: hypothetical protein ACUVQ5_06160 [Candidatus Methanomethylicaceae archaeon]